MRKYLKQATTFIILLFLFNCISIYNADASVIKLNKTKETIQVGETVSLKIIGSNNRIVWKSDNKNIVKVDKNGNATGIKEGKTKIIAIISEKSYKCTITVKNKYGTVSGCITWQYNKYIGTKADVGAYVALIPKNKLDLKSLNNSVLSLFVPINGKNGIYATTVDGNGNYSINHVQTGEYLVFVVSKKTTDKDRFDDEANWKISLESKLSSYLSDKDLGYLESFMGFQSYTTSTISIYENENTTFSYDFGYTYI